MRRRLRKQRSGWRTNLQAATVPTCLAGTARASCPASSAARSPRLALEPSGMNMGLNLTVNGDHLTSTADPVTPLVDVLREEFHLTGAKPVCREGFCGACMVLIDGNPTPSCLMPVALAHDCDIRTVEGL